MADGRIALCGIDCARDFFGEEIVNRFGRDLQAQIDRETRVRILERTVNGAGAALYLLKSEWIELENAYLSAVRGVRAWLDDDGLAGKIQDDCLIVRKRRDSFVNTTTRDGQERRERRTVEEVVARAVGASSLLYSTKSLGLAQGGLSVLARAAQDPDGIRGKKIDELAKKRQEVIERINQGTAFVRSAFSFFQHENVEQFLRWYRNTYSGGQPSIKFVRGLQLTISHPEPKGLPTYVALPKALPDSRALIELLSGKNIG
jgi:hypothetical protein